MKKIKNVFLLAAMAVSAVTFTACDKENENENENNNTQQSITEIKATVSTEGVPTTVDSVTFEVKGNDGSRAVTKGTYINGALTVTLPTTLESKYLSTIDDFGTGVTVSDRTAKMYEDDDDANIYVWKDGIKVGEFRYGNATGDAGLHYVDKDVTITGTATETEDDGWTYIYNFNISLKRGWNIVFFTDSENETTKTHTSNVTTTVPSGLKWYFLPRE